MYSTAATVIMVSAARLRKTSAASPVRATASAVSGRTRRTPTPPAARPSSAIPRPAWHALV